MGDGTKIQWTEATWNPVRGCSRVSKGCENCYAEHVARRFAGVGQPYEGLVRLDKAGKPKAQWNGVVQSVQAHLFDPLRWTKPRLVFVNSMSDLFHDALTEASIARVYAIMALAERHTFQVLTKRSARMRKLLNSEAFWTTVSSTVEAMMHVSPKLAKVSTTWGGWVGVDAWASAMVKRRTLPNVLVGVSVEDQEAADERIPDLLATSAALRWVSYEPALGPVDWREELMHGRFVTPGSPNPSIDWIVVGGESGPGARRFNIAWARSTLRACADASVPCFVKQLGADARDESGYALSLDHPKGGEPSEWPEDLRVREWPEVRHA